MNAKWLLTVTVVTAIVVAASALAIESGSGAPAGRSSGPQPVGTRVIGAPVKICVANVEGLWRYTYGAACGVRSATARLPYSYHDLVVPADTRVDLLVTADHGQHVVTIRNLGLTIDAESGAASQTSFLTMGVGETYKGLCHKNCGHDRESASADVIVMTGARYRKWLTAQAQAIERQGAQTSHLRTDLIDEGVFAPSVGATRH
jgi:heme/copper-type cytochrome/quinol oxidase subunit 2